MHCSSLLVSVGDSVEQGEVPGNLENSFSLNEYNGNLRLVTTVNEYWFEEIRDLFKSKNFSENIQCFSLKAL